MPDNQKSAVVLISLTETGTYNLIGYVTNHAYDLVRERGDTKDYYGGAKHTGAGRTTRTLGLDGDVHMPDATGQDVARTAAEDELDPTVWLRVLRNGVGSAGRQFPAKINNYTEDNDANSTDPPSFDLEFQIEAKPTAVVAT